jgi:hypothetical protein
MRFLTSRQGPSRTRLPQMVRRHRMTHLPFLLLLSDWWDHRGRLLLRDVERVRGDDCLARGPEGSGVSSRRIL